MTRPRCDTKWAKALVALFFLAVALLGLFTADDYGRPWDELSEIRIFRMAIMEYGEALPFETGFHKTLGEMGVIPLSESVEMDHNFALYYPLAWAACDSEMDINQFAKLWRAHTWLIFTLGLWSLYAICRRMGLSRPLCLLAVTLMLLSPRFFADGHYNNKDIALMALTGLVLWQTLRLAQKPSLPRALLFALCAGMCVNTRIIGVAICGLCGLFVPLRLMAEKRLHKREVLVGLCALGASLLCYVLLTPALLNDPLGYLEYVVRSSYNFTRWNGTLIFMGEQISLASSKPPFYYLPVNILLTTPLLQLCLVAVGTVATIRKTVRERLECLRAEPGYGALLSLLLWVLPLLGCMLLRVRVYNGWRHIYFVYIPMMATAAWGLHWLRGRLGTRRGPGRIAAGLLALALLAQGALLWLNHPYQYAFYNALVHRETIDRRYELDYWNISVYQALMELLECAGDEPVIRVAPTDERTKSGIGMAISYMAPTDAVRFERVDYQEELRDTFYTVANTSYRVSAGVELPEDLRPIVTVDSYGATICTVYACDSDKGELP